MTLKVLWENLVIIASVLLIAYHLGQPASIIGAISDPRKIPSGPRDLELWAAAMTKHRTRGPALPYDRLLVCADLHGDLEQAKEVLHMIGATDKVVIC